MFNPAPSFYDGLANWLEIARYDINREWRHKQLTKLLQELEPMRFRITEPTFWRGQERKVGDELEDVAGPFRTQLGAGGLQKINQFVELPEQIVTEPTIPPPVTPIPAPKPVAKSTPLAARVRALTGRHTRFQDAAGLLLSDGEKAMTTLETDGPGILQRATQSMQDGVTAIIDLGDSLKELDRANGGPLSD